MESDFNLVECFQGEDNHCVITRVCGLRGVLAAALRAYFAVLDAYSLQDLVEKPAALNRALGQDGGASLVGIPVKSLARKTRSSHAERGDAGE
jgi:Rrf2 family nitric oxide-sensitive transcriptional repressor